MKKILLLFVIIHITITMTAQYGYFYGFSYNKINTNVEDQMGNYIAILGVTPSSPADLSGLKPFDLILSIDGIKIDEKEESLNLFSKPEVEFEVLRLGNIHKSIKVKGMIVSTNNFIPEAEWATIGMNDGQYSLYSTTRTLDIDPIQVFSDPEASLYQYSKYDFDFSESNTLQQKEIASYLEPILAQKGLKRDRVNPEMIIIIDFYSDRRDQYVPPTQRLVTRYKYGFEIGSGWGTRQYVESQKSGDYTKTEFLTKMTITMLDAQKMAAEPNKSANIWAANYETLSTMKVEIKAFTNAIGLAMLNCFPIKNISHMDVSYYWGIGLLYDNKKEGLVVGVVPGSPAAQAGIRVGDELISTRPGSSRFPYQMENTIQNLGQKRHKNYLNYNLYRSSNTTYENESINQYINRMYTSTLHTPDYKVNQLLEIKIKRPNKTKYVVKVKPIYLKYYKYVLNN
ncbi:MAG: PDZ domain-containing protein [Bacteroidales bacterium]|nr:PDZ domain-containing protein [Bacteroidales bacterium]